MSTLCERYPHIDIDLSNASMPNTELVYLYRDGCNNKTGIGVVLPGRITEPELETLLDTLEGDATFVPGQVGLGDLQDSFASPSEWIDDYDGPWHEITDVQYTATPATTDQTIAELVAAFQSARWDNAYRPAFYPEMRRRYEERVRREEELGEDA